MTTNADQIDVTVSLPSGLAEEAEASGLLSSEMVEAMLREELRTERVRRLFDAADRLSSESRTSLSADEVEREIHAARAERRKVGASRS